MLSIFVVQLPFSVCAVWFLLTLFKSHKTHSDRLLATILGFLAVSFYCGSNHMSPYPNYPRLVILDIIMQFTVLSVFPLICLYIRSLYEETHERHIIYLLFLPSLLQMVSTIVVTSLLGVQGCADLINAIYNGVIVTDRLDVLESAYLNLSYKSFNLIFFVELIASMVYVVSRLFTGKFKFAHISAFLRGQKSSFVANILCSLFVVYFILWAICIVFMEPFMNTLSIWSSLWSFFVALLLFFVAYVAAIPPLPGGYMNIDRMRHPFSAMRQSRQEFLKGINSGPVAEAPASGFDKIMESFQQLMVNDQEFLNPSLTIDEIARQLNTNRTYVSKLVNIYYGVPFRDYLNNLRLDYAKRLLMDEPDAVIDYVAAKSGFQSSTQFIRKFRETEGVTPTVWRSTQRKSR